MKDSDALRFDLVPHIMTEAGSVQQTLTTGF